MGKPKKQKWTEEEKDILVRMYGKFPLEHIAQQLPLWNISSIKTKIRKMKLNKKIYVDNSSLPDLFKSYKDVLNGNQIKLYCVGIKREHLILLFKYYLSKNSIQTDRNFWINSIIGSVLEKAGLKQRVKKSFKGYYDFISCCYPKYKFKEWEFRWLNVSDGFWDDQANRISAIKFGIQKMLSDGIIKNEIEVLSISSFHFEKYFHQTLITYRGYGFLYEYFNFNKINIEGYDCRYCEGILFSSKEEKDVYLFLKNYFPNIRKCNSTDKLYNYDFNENYIPDFIADDIVIEYYGMYKSKDNNIHDIYKTYKEKTLRKHRFYEKSNYRYLPIFKEDMKKNGHKLLSKIIRIKGGDNLNVI